MDFINSHKNHIDNVTNFKPQNFDIWHFRLGHPSNKSLDRICKYNSDIQYNSTNICDSCYFFKQHRLSFPDSIFVTSDVFDLVHIDIWGSFGITSIHRHTYFFTIDDFSRHTWICLMKNKSKTRSLLNNFVILLASNILAKGLLLLLGATLCEKNYKPDNQSFICTDTRSARRCFYEGNE